MMGIAKYLLDKDVSIRIDFNDPREIFTVKGKFVRAEDVEGKKEMVALGLNFDEATVPMGYKIRLNDMLTSTRADYRGTLEDNGQSSNQS
ncbi:MAG: hypothetical protein FWD40_05085 [Treponema sp.]|nr:hypothetical protein [Treponema sp.]